MDIPIISEFISNFNHIEPARWLFVLTMAPLTFGALAADVAANIRGSA